MKKIGFVDLYISEWHADNYPGWITEVSKQLGLEYEVAYAWAEQEISPVDGLTTDAWCEKMGIGRCATLAELCEKSDCIVVLAPSNPEAHLRLAQGVLPYGKRTYIDKTFAPDLETAQEIFALAEKYSTPFFSTSALRCADELAMFQGAKNLIVTGGGSNLEEYCVHIIEMAVKVLQTPAKEVKVERIGSQRICTVVTETGEKAALIYSRKLPYRLAAETAEGKAIGQQVSSEFFKNLMADILRFFESGELPFDGKETLEVMRLRDAILKADRQEGRWVKL